MKKDKYKFKLNKPAEGKNNRRCISTVYFGPWNYNRRQRIRGLKFRWFPYGELKNKFGIKYFDHMTTHVDDNGIAVVESQPYQSVANVIKELKPYCDAYGINIQFGESDWAPGSTISIEFRDMKVIYEKKNNVD